MTADSLKFTDVRKGQRARIVSVPQTVPDARRLAEMGLTEGAEFTVIKVAPFGDPIEIDIRGYRLCLRKRESRWIEIEAVE